MTHVHIIFEIVKIRVTSVTWYGLYFNKNTHELKIIAFILSQLIETGLHRANFYNIRQTPF